MPRFDFKCANCGEVSEWTFRSADEADSAPVVCSFCTPVTAMVRQPSAPSFVLKGFSAKNGYSSS